MQRLREIDFLRGSAILMMALFHFLWDLNYFNIIKVGLYSGFWGLFQITTASLFLVLVGVMLAVNSHRKVNFRADFLQKGASAFACGLAITAATLVFFPRQFIYFGIMHLIGVSIVLSIPFAQKKFTNLALAIMLIAIPIFWSAQSLGIGSLTWLGLAQPLPTLDFFPVIPWFGAVLLGIFIGNVLYKNGEGISGFKMPEFAFEKLVEKLGRNSLFVYLAHQLVLFPLAFIISLLI